MAVNPHSAVCEQREAFPFLQLSIEDLLRIGVTR